MAEVAGLVVSAVGIAAEGLKISATITDFIGRFQDASEEIRLVVSDVQATAEVLELLKQSLDAENQAGLKWTSTKSLAEDEVSLCHSSILTKDLAFISKR